LSQGAIVSWSSDYSLFKVLSGDGTASATFYISNFKRFLPTMTKVLANISINGQVLTLTKDVQLGTATPEFLMIDSRNGTGVPSFSGFTSVPYYFRVKNVPLSPIDYNYTWTIYSPPTDFITLGMGQQISFSGVIEGTYRIKLQYDGVCGLSQDPLHTFNLINQTTLLTTLSVYPNPASDLLNVSLTEQNTAQISSSSLRASATTIEPYSIQLWNERYGLVRTVESTESNLQISLHGLPKGMNFVLLVRNKKTLQKQILWIK
jgi:hypothetical protein